MREVAIVKEVCRRRDGLTTHELELTTGVLCKRKGPLGGEVGLSVGLSVTLD